MPDYTPITHIIFDLDGLLIDSEPLWERAEDTILREYIAELDPKIRQKHIGLRLDEAAQVMIDGYGLAISADALAEIILTEMFVLLKTEAVAMPGAAEALRACHAAGYPLAIASSSRRDYIETVLAALGWAELVQTIASAYETPRGKPAPDVYNLALERLGATPAATLALEDSLNGARAAQAAGLLTVAIPGAEFAPKSFENVADVLYPDLPTFLQAFLS